jgi:hypothetical protein
MAKLLVIAMTGVNLLWQSLCTRPLHIYVGVCTRSIARNMTNGRKYLKKFLVNEIKSSYRPTYTLIDTENSTD